MDRVLRLIFARLIRIASFRWVCSLLVTDIEILRRGIASNRYEV